MAFSGVSGSMEEDFFTKSQSWKNVRQNRNQDAAHAQKRVTVPLRFWFQSNLELGRENWAGYLETQVGKTFSYQGHALVTFYVQFLCSDKSKFDKWVHAENLCSTLKPVHFDSWSWQSFVSTSDVFNCLFALDVQNEIQLLSRVCCYSWLVCLSVFWLRDASLVKVRNPISDGIVFVFHLAWCVRGLKSLKRFRPYLIAFGSCISNDKPE